MNLPRAEFSDVIVSGWRITPRETRSGQVKIVAWSPEQIAWWHGRKARFDKWGRPVTVPAKWCGRKVTGGAVGWLARRFDVPLAVPGKQNTLIANNHFSTV